MTIPLTILDSRAVLLPADDIDTDQIIPARFLKTTERRGLGQHLFADWRYDATGAPVHTFPLNAPGAAARAVLVAGRNFGCGSSREHAPWALADFGFRVVVARSFADIFRNNALKNGLLPIALGDDAHVTLSEAVRSDPRTMLRVDVVAQAVALPDGTSWHFELDAFARHCLLHGVDQLGYLLAAEPEIDAFERRSPSRIDTIPVAGRAAHA